MADIGASLATGATVAIVSTCFCLLYNRLIKKIKWIAIQLDAGHLLMCFPMGGSEHTTEFIFHLLIMSSIVYATCFMAKLVFFLLLLKQS